MIFSNEKAGFYVREACWIMIPLGVASLTTSIQNSLGLEYKSLVSYFAGGLGMILCLWFLPQYTGPNCLVLGTGIGMTVTSMINVNIICKQTKLKGDFGNTLAQVCIFALVSGILGLSLSNLCCLMIGKSLSLALCCAICVLAYLMLATIFDTAEINLLWQTMICNIPKSKKIKPLQ